MKGKQILITRPRREAGPLLRMLQTLGAEATVLPLIQIEPLSDVEIAQHHIEQQVRSLPDELGVILSSQNGVRYFVRLLRRLGLPMPQFNRFMAAVGPVSGRLWRRYSGRQTLYPDNGDSGAKALLKLIERHWSASHVGTLLLPTALNEGEPLRAGLQSLGMRAMLLPCYKNSRLPLSHEDRQSLLDRSWHAIVFYSPSAVRSLTASLSTDEKQKISALPTVAVGHSTAAALEQQGFSQITIAASPQVKSIVAAML